MFYSSTTQAQTKDICNHMYVCWSFPIKQSFCWMGAGEKKLLAKKLRSCKTLMHLFVADHFHIGIILNAYI